MCWFSPLKHLARGDIIFKPGKIIVLIKWSKTMQNNNQVKLISVPRIAGSILCPVHAISNLLALTPKGANLPLFQYKQNSKWVPLTDSKVRRHFSLVLSRLGLQGSNYTLHTFRCPVKFFCREIFLLPVFLPISTLSRMRRNGYIINRKHFI